MSVKVGKIIRDARIERGLTCAALGAIVDLNASTISRIENGKCAPKDESITAIAQALGLSKTQLMQTALRIGLGEEQEPTDADPGS